MPKRLPSVIQNAVSLHKQEKRPYVLLLGAGCSVSSGCPSAQELIENLVRDNKLSSKKTYTLPDLEKKLGKDTFNSNLKKYFSNSYPSKGYWFLAELIKWGYFDLILTTNYDSCLEKILAKVVNQDEFRVYIRGDINDERIDELITLDAPKIKIVKLHGDYQSTNMVVNLKALWNIKPPLIDTLKSEIKRRGVIVIGYSMHEPPILEVLSKDVGGSFWYISKNPADNRAKKLLDRIPIKHRKHGYDFDEFFALLSKGLGKPIPNERFFNNNKEKIIESYKIQEADTYKLFADLSKLCLEIMRTKIENLIFIHDPDAPGGSELLKLIEKRHQEIIKKRNVYKLHVEGRGKKKRAVTRFEVIKENIANAPERYLLIDSVSFSGRTLEICREYLVDKKGLSITVGAAVIYSGRPQEKKLLEDTYCFKELFLKVEPIDTHQILFPWGLTQATDSIFSEEPEPNTIDEYVPHKYFSFLPRPWGNIFSMMENKQITIKILYLYPREMTSKHKHFCRNEIFFVLDEKVVLQVWDEHILLRKGASLRIPVGTEHRFIGLDEPCRVLEISQNYHDQKEDIKRLEDKYRRRNKKGDV